MKFKISLSFFCLAFISSINSMDKKIEAEDPQEMLFEGATHLENDLINNALEKGAKINAINKNGQTALHLATTTGFMISRIEELEKIIKLLLKHGADLNITDKHNETALIYAVAFTHRSLEKKSDNIINLLLNIEICKTSLRLARERGLDIIAKTVQYEPKKRIIEMTNLIPDLVNIIFEYLDQQEKTKEVSHA